MGKFKDRHSTRLFVLSTPVSYHDRWSLKHLPWRSMHLELQHPAVAHYLRCARSSWPTTRLKASLLAVAKAGAPIIPPLPATFRHYRSSALGMQLYGVGMAIAHDDIEGRAAAVLRNFDFYGAPLAAINIHASRPRNTRCPHCWFILYGFRPCF